MNDGGVSWRKDNWRMYACECPADAKASDRCARNITRCNPRLAWLHPVPGPPTWNPIACYACSARVGCVREEGESSRYFCFGCGKAEGGPALEEQRSTDVVKTRLAALAEIEALCALWEPSTKRDLMVQAVINELRRDGTAKTDPPPISPPREGWMTALPLHKDGGECLAANERSCGRAHVQRVGPFAPVCRVGCGEFGRPGKRRCVDDEWADCFNHHSAAMVAGERACFCSKTCAKAGRPARPTGEVFVVHYLLHGLAPCGLPGIPADWPPGHKWHSDWPEVTCDGCLARAPAATEGPAK